MDPRTLCPLTFAAAPPQGVSFKVERCLQHSAGTVPPPQLSLLRPGASRQMPTSLCVQERVPAATFPDSPRGLRRGATLPHCANGARSPPSQEAGPGESFSVPPSASLAIFNLSNEPCYKYSLALVADQDTQERAAPPLRSLATPARHAPWLSLLCRPPARPLAPAPPCPPPPTGLATAPQAARWTSTQHTLASPGEGSCPYALQPHIHKLPCKLPMECAQGLMF